MKNTEKQQQVPATITNAVKIIAACLRHNSDAYGAYKLRRVRYNLLRNNGIKANMTYPQSDPAIAVNHDFKPVVIRHLNRFAGSGCAPILTDTFGVKNTKSGKTRRLRATA